MLRIIYLSPLGYFISIIFTILGRIFRPFMVYGYWDSSAKSFRKFTRYSSTVVFLDRSKIGIGDNCWIWHHSIIDGSNGVHIGEGVQIGAWVGIFSHSSHLAIRLHGNDYINIDKDKRLGYVRAGVEIGDYSFIGAGACILPGVKIGRGSLVAAGAVVSKSIPDFSVVSGNPAKVIGSTIDMDRKFFDDPLVQQSYFDPEVIKNYNAKKKTNSS